MIATMGISENIHVTRAQYVCTFHADRSGGYSVRCAAFPQLVSHGDSLEDARAMAREALELCLEVYEEEGRPPPPSDGDARAKKREIAPTDLARP